MNTLDTLKRKTLFKILYWIARFGFIFTMIASGARKLPGVKFTTLPVEHPVGAYFQAMFDTGIYWNFIGYAQILIGLLLIFNRTVIMAILLMMPIVINIFLISVTLQMKGTPVITGAMVLGNLFLIVWHFRNYKTIFMKPVA